MMSDATKNTEILGHTDKNASTVFPSKKNILEAVLSDKEKIKYKKNLLKSIIEKFFNSEYLSYYCWKCWQECTDWSDLYILAKEGIIKVWCWEFNRDTFINWVYSEHDKKYLEKYKFNDSPLPLYVVNQTDSYLANDKLRKLREENPIEYLEKYTVLSYNPENKTVVSNYGKLAKSRKNVNINKDTIAGVSDAILLFRNKFIENFDKKFLNEYMSKLQKFTLEDLKRYARNSEKITDENEIAVRNIIYNKMWCIWVGAWIYTDEAIKSRYDLIKSFDTNKWEFTSIPEFSDDD